MFHGGSKYSTEGFEHSTEGLNIPRRGSKYSTEGVKYSTEGLNIPRRWLNIPWRV